MKGKGERDIGEGSWDYWTTYTSAKAEMPRLAGCLLSHSSLWRRLFATLPLLEAQRGLTVSAPLYISTHHTNQLSTSLFKSSYRSSPRKFSSSAVIFFFSLSIHFTFDTLATTTLLTLRSLPTAFRIVYSLLLLT